MPPSPDPIPLPSPAVPLYVDLDRTLLRVDLLLESAAGLLRRWPWLLVPMLWQLLRRGRAALKAWVARRVEVDPATLPANAAVVELIGRHRAAGGAVILATASCEAHANAVAGCLGPFAGVLSSSVDENLKGVRKLAAIEADARQRGAAAFAYVGDCAADAPILSAAGRGYLYSHNRGWARRFLAAHPKVLWLGQDPAGWTDYLRAMRPHQWAKNVLLFLPLLLAHQWSRADLWGSTLLAFVIFSLLTSAVYLFNDFVDLERDRCHPTKRERPMASGAVPVWNGLALGLCLGAGALLASTSLMERAFTEVLLGYAVMNIGYSFWLKNQPMLDVILLTLMYALRMLAGGTASGVYVSDWLLSFGLFFFLSIAFGKRYQELNQASRDGALAVRIRGYVSADLRLLDIGGIAAGLISALVLALYIRSEAVAELYAEPRILWFLCPVLLYWIGRFWVGCLRGQMADDPVVYALKDPVSYFAAAASALVVIAAKWGWVSI